jgi:WD40 repeat protein
LLTKTEKCLKIIKGHYGEVSHLDIHGNYLYSASLDGTLRCWDLTDPNLGEEVVPADDDEPTNCEELTEEEERELAALME